MSTTKFYSTTRALLDDLLEGTKPFGPKELDAVRAELDEDDFLDFKGGKLSQAQLRGFLWEYVTGFANAAGGVLIVGVSNTRPRKIEDIGHTIPGTEEPHVWAEKNLGMAAARVHPPPRFLTVRHGGAKVLVIATPTASPALIPMPGTEPRYAMRIGNSTRILPPHLVADLLVGRRAVPALEVSDPDIGGALRGGQNDIFGVSFACRVENDSFVYARRVVVGCVVHCLYGDYVPRPARRVLQEIEVVDTVGTVRAHATNLVWQLHHPLSMEIEVLRPFESVALAIPPTGRGSFTNLPFIPDAFLRFGLYVLAEGAPPTWYQGTLEYIAGGSEILRPLAGTPKLERIVGRRPVVSWRERGV